MARRDRKIEFVVGVVDEASRNLNTIGAKFAAFTKRVAINAAKVAAAFTAVGAAAFAMANKVSKQLDVYDKLSKRLNISVEALSQFQFIAERSGITFNNMALALQRMSRRVAEASTGTGEAVTALQRLNLSAKGLIQLSPDRQFKAIAKALTEIENPAERLSVAFKLFDSEGVAVLQTLDKGIEGFEAMANAADRLGATIGTDAVKRAADFQDALANLQGAMRGAAAEGTTNLLPVLTDMVNFFANKLPQAVAFLDKALVVVRQKFVLLAAGIVKALGIMSVVLSKLPGGQGRLADGFVDQMIALEAALKDQAAAYEPAIRAAEEYIRKLKEVGVQSNTVTGLNSPTARVGSADIPLDIIKVTSKKKPVKEFFDFITEAGKRAAANLQDAFAEFFFDPFEGGLKGLLANFINVIRRMIAEVLAFNTIKVLGGNKSSGLGKIFAGVFGRASGGPIAAGQSVRVHEGEIVTGGASGANVRSRAAQRTEATSMMPTIRVSIDARGADPGLIQRLPGIMEQQEKKILLAVNRFLKTGEMPI